MADQKVRDFIEQANVALDRDLAETYPDPRKRRRARQRHIAAHFERQVLNQMKVLDSKERVTLILASIKVAIPRKVGPAFPVIPGEMPLRGQRGVISRKTKRAIGRPYREARRLRNKQASWARAVNRA